MSQHNSSHKGEFTIMQNIQAIFSTFDILS